MEIHLFSPKKRPPKGSIVSTHCGKKAPFVPKYIDLYCLRICPECLEKYLLLKGTLKETDTFPLIK